MKRIIALIRKNLTMLTCEHEFSMWTYVGELYTFECEKCKLMCKVDNRESRKKCIDDPKLNEKG